MRRGLPNVVIVIVAFFLSGGGDWTSVEVVAGGAGVDFFCVDAGASFFAFGGGLGLAAGF